MLPPFIIEQIRKREQEDKWRHEQPRVEIQPETAYRKPASEPSDRETDREPAMERGVIILELI